MLPKTKAKKLVESYMYLVYEFSESGFLSPTVQTDLVFLFAKKCAHKLVMNILTNVYAINTENTKYWAEVFEEITQLEKI